MHKTFGLNAHGEKVVATITMKRPDGGIVELPEHVAAICSKKPGWDYASGAEAKLHEPPKAEAAAKEHPPKPAKAADK